MGTPLTEAPEKESMMSMRSGSAMSDFILQNPISPVASQLTATIDSSMPLPTGMLYKKRHGEGSCDSGELEATSFQPLDIPVCSADMAEGANQERSLLGMTAGHCYAQLVACLRTRALLADLSQDVERRNELLIAINRAAADCGREPFRTLPTALEASDTAWEVSSRHRIGKPLTYTVATRRVSAGGSDPLSISWVRFGSVRYAYVVGTLGADGSAAQAGVKPGLELICVDGKEIFNDSSLRAALALGVQRREMVMCFYDPGEAGSTAVAIPAALRTRDEHDTPLPTMRRHSSYAKGAMGSRKTSAGGMATPSYVTSPAVSYRSELNHSISIEPSYIQRHSSVLSYSTEYPVANSTSPRHATYNTTLQLPPSAMTKRTNSMASSCGTFHPPEADRLALSGPAAGGPSSSVMADDVANLGDTHASGESAATDTSLRRHSRDRLGVASPPRPPLPPPSQDSPTAALARAAIERQRSQLTHLDRSGNTSPTLGERSPTSAAASAPDPALGPLTKTVDTISIVDTLPCDVGNPKEGSLNCSQQDAASEKEGPDISKGGAEPIDSGYLKQLQGRFRDKVKKRVPVANFVILLLAVAVVILVAVVSQVYYCLLVLLLLPLSFLF